MPLEAATFINQLDPSNPVGATDTKAQGDDHLRLLKSTLQATFPNISGAMQATQAQLNYLKDATGTTGDTTKKLVFDEDPILVDASISLIDGAVGTPALRFGLDTNTGWYRRGADDMAAATNGTLRFVIANGFCSTSGVPHGFADGAAATPGLYFNDDPNTGIYRVGTDAIGFSAGGAERARINTAGIRYQDGSSGSPSLAFIGDTALGLFRTPGGSFAMAAAGTTFFAASAAAGGVVIGDTAGLGFLGANTVNISGLHYSSREAGWRNMPRSDKSGSYTFVDSDRGTAIVYTGAGGHTFTIDDSITATGVITLLNGGSGSISLVGSGVTISWFNGGGVSTPGSRTLAVAGMCSIWKSSAGNAVVAGPGLS